MKFAILLDTDVRKVDLVEEAERLGFHRAWIPDSQMIWSDCYATMALAADRTDRILLATGITCPGTRVAATTAAAIASISKLAPGRVALGVGTGHTAMRLMGQPPASPGELQEYIRVIRGLLSGRPVDYTRNGKTAQIQFMNQDRRYIDFEHEISIYVAANGPKALQLAGEAGDGWITAGGITVDVVARDGAKVKDAAAAIRRTLPPDYPRVNVISCCVLQPGETLRDDRVIDQTGASVAAALHFSYEVWEQRHRDDQLIPPHFAKVWDAYVARVEGFSADPSERYRQVHEGHATYLVPEERGFITPEAIRGCCLVGKPDEVVAQIQAMARAGLTEVALNTPADAQWDVMRDVARLVMPRFG